MPVGRGFFDNQGRLLRELDEAERTALNAAGRHVVRRFTCFVARNHAKPAFLGSGTLISAQERVYVATAKHLFERLDAHEAGWPTSFGGGGDAELEVRKQG